jgi:hypothetical protein
MEMAIVCYDYMDSINPDLMFFFYKPSAKNGNGITAKNYGGELEGVKSGDRIGNVLNAMEETDFKVKLFSVCGAVNR